HVRATSPSWARRRWTRRGVPSCAPGVRCAPPLCSRATTPVATSSARRAPAASLPLRVRRLHHEVVDLLQARQRTDDLVADGGESSHELGLVGRREVDQLPTLLGQGLAAIVVEFYRSVDELILY